MARVFIDGFESGGLGCWDYSSQFVVTSTYKYTGTYGANSNGWINGNAFKYVPSRSDYYVAFKVRPTTYTAPLGLGVYEGSVPHITLFATQDGAGFVITVRRGTVGGTSLVSSTVVHALSVWMLVEVYVLINDTTGRIIIKVNGVEEINFTGDTRNGGTLGQIDRILLGCPDQNHSHAFDDFAVDDANWIGDTRIVAITPNGAGNSTQWNPSAGANYDCVNEVPPSDTDYVYTEVADEVDTYAASDLPAEAAVIKSIQVTALARKEGAGPAKLAVALRTTGGDAYSTDKDLQYSFSPHSRLWETNPGTAAPWEISEVNAMEIGVKSRT